MNTIAELAITRGPVVIMDLLLTGEEVTIGGKRYWYDAEDYYLRMPFDTKEGEMWLPVDCTIGQFMRLCYTLTEAEYIVICTRNALRKAADERARKREEAALKRQAEEMK